MDGDVAKAVSRSGAPGYPAAAYAGYPGAWGGWGWGWGWWWWIFIFFIFLIAIAWSWGGWGVWGAYPRAGWAGARYN
ncbi:MAG TPA: hypothetical protein GXX28_04285 [Firmicutes bacterium]|nr:hypothetical protein [Bacillota bacterium]